MIVVGSIIAVSLIGAYIFLGIKLSESIVNPDVNIFFWGLYITSLMTLINVSMSIFFYTSIISKKGPLGPRGSKGKMGDRGESGSCGDDCKSKTLQLMVEQEIKDETKDEPTPMEKKKICAIIKKNDIKKMDFEKLNNFKTRLKTNINSTYWENIRTERIIEQNKSNDLTKIYELMNNSSSSIFETDDTIDECIE
tara:strand:+ start:232 stop:816 length:585 start_codon:yes stop_codon:yes gene_type:complete